MANPSFSLSAIGDQAIALGRAAIFYAVDGSDDPTYWDGTGDIKLKHLGYSEGAVAPDPKTEFSVLTLDELTGPAPIRVYQKGEAPVLQFNVLCDSAAAAKLFSPTGKASAGYQRWREARYVTLVLFPEALFLEANAEVSVAYAKAPGAGWTVGGDAATAEQLALIALSMWFWKGYFSRATLSYNPADGGKATRQVEFVSVQDLTKPDGEQLYTVGDPADATIDIDAGA